MSDPNATQTGAEDFKPAYGQRTSAIDQIAKGVNASYAEDLAQFNEDTGQITPLEKTPVEPAAEETPGDTTPEQEAAAESQTPAPEDDLIAIVVDGQEVKVKRDQLIDAGRRTLQKESAADRRLQDATETLNRAKAYERSLMQQGQPSPDVGNEEQVPSSDASNGNSAQATPDLRTLVKQELWKENAVKAADRFAVEFKEIADDPLAYQLVVQLENDRLAQAAAEGLPLGDPWNAYKAHGEKVMTWLGKTRGTTPAIPDDKTERKRGTVTVVGSGTRQPAPQAPKVLTLSEQIEKMRTGRQGRPVQPNR